jgi:uncharacterized protein YcnI
MNRIILPRAAALTAAVAILVLSAPLAASAHVKISPNTAVAGADIAVAFRVPNESATAGTVKVEIDLPTNTPFAGARYQPVQGWTAQLIIAKLAKPIKNDGVVVTDAPAKVIYTANPGVQIRPGQFQEFSLALDLTPNTGSVEFPTYQTYSDGTVVKWAQKTPKSGVAPDNPAPILYINDAPPANTGAGVTVAATDAASSTATSALILGSAGLALGVIALVLAVFAFARSRRV